MVCYGNVDICNCANCAKRRDEEHALVLNQAVVFPPTGGNTGWTFPVSVRRESGVKRTLVHVPCDALGKLARKAIANKTKSASLGGIRATAPKV